MSTNDFYFESCLIYDKYFKVNNKILVIPELWSYFPFCDECYYKFISPYCINYYSKDNDYYDSLDIIDRRFLEGIEKCGKLALFLFNPIELMKYSETKVYNNPIYKELIHELIFIGYNIISFEGSALTDGIYPIYLENEISGDLKYDNSINISVNKFGLLDNLKDCYELCEINNKNVVDEIYSWFPRKVYVDKFTFKIINI